MENPFDQVIEKLTAIEQRQIAIEKLLRSIQQPTPEETTEKPLSQTEAVEFLGKSRQTLVKWRRQGIIQGYKLGGRIYFKPSELIAGLEKLGE